MPGREIKDAQQYYLIFYSSFPDKYLNVIKYVHKY